MAPAGRYTAGMAELFDVAFLRKLEVLTLQARRMFRGTMRGEQRSPRAGASVEFADYRQYAPGDDFRHVDWNAYARFETLFLKLFRHEEDLHLFLLCDGSASMALGRPGKFDYARRVCAALGYVALHAGNRVSLHVTGAEPDSAAWHGPWRGKAAIFRVFDALAGAQPAGQADLLGSVRGLLTRKPHPGVLVVCSDLLLPEGYEKALDLLQYERFQPMIIHVLSPQEISPTLEGSRRLLDSETAEPLDVSPTADVLAGYRTRLDAFRRSAEEFCRRRAAEYVFSSTDQPFEELVLRWMRQANIVR